MKGLLVGNVAHIIEALNDSAAGYFLKFDKLTQRMVLGLRTLQLNWFT